MALEVQADGNVVTVKVNGKLSKSDYETFAPRVEESIVQHGKIRILLVMEDFHGWEMGALWEDIKFDVKHFRDIEKLAMVGDAKWEQWMAAFCKPFTTASVKSFRVAQLDQAAAWLRE